MRIGRGEFLLGDCLDRLSDVSDTFVDLVVTSPPYDNLRSYNDGDAWTFETFKAVAKQLERVLKPGGVIVWNVNDATVNGSETGTSFRQALHFKDECGLHIHDTMIWQKAGTGAVGSNKAYWQSFEYMFILSKGSPKTIHRIADVENAYAGEKTSGSRRKRNGQMKPAEPRVIPDFSTRSNVWRIPVGNNGNKSVVNHPATFPIALPHDHIISWSNPGDLILDPFAGSGTTAIAAERTERDWLCIERDHNYFWQAIARISAELYP